MKLHPVSLDTKSKAPGAQRPFLALDSLIPYLDSLDPLFLTRCVPISKESLLRFLIL